MVYFKLNHTFYVQYVRVDMCNVASATSVAFGFVILISKVLGPTV